MLLPVKTREKHICYFAPGRGQKYCNECICCICMCVCMHACLLTYFKNHTSKLHKNFMRVLAMAMSQCRTSPIPVRWQSWLAACPSCTLQMMMLLRGWPSIVAYRGCTRQQQQQSSSANSAICYMLLVLWITSCLHIIGQTKAMPTAHMLNVTHQGQHWDKVWCLGLFCCACTCYCTRSSEKYKNQSFTRKKRKYGAQQNTCLTTYFPGQPG